MPLVSEAEEREERARERVLLERAELMEALLVSPGWKAFVEIISEHSAVKVQEVVFGETKTDADIYSEQRAKGHLRGLDWALRQPSLIIAAAKDIRSRATTDEHMDEGE